MNKHRFTSARWLLLAASALSVLATCSPYVVETREGAGAVAPYFFGLGYVTLYAGSARTDLWAFGRDEVSRCEFSHSAAAARWDGSRWTLTPLPADLGPPIAAVSIAPNEAWMLAPSCSNVEGYALVRWNGVEWSVVGRNRDWQNADGLASIRRASPTDVWVHLATTNIAGPPRVAISRWNGAALSQIPAPPRHELARRRDRGRRRGLGLRRRRQLGVSLSRWGVDDGDDARQHRPDHRARADAAG